MSSDEVAGMLEGSAIEQAAVNANGMQKRAAWGLEAIIRM
jgi:hypothetical protein